MNEYSFNIRIIRDYDESKIQYTWRFIRNISLQIRKQFRKTQHQPAKV